MITHRLIGFFLFILYILAVFLFNVLPLGFVEKIQEPLWGEFRLDYLSHALIFLPWIFFHLCFPTQKKRLWFVVGLVIALLIEGIQYYLPYRGFNMYDIIFNVVGLLMGYLLFTGLYFKLQTYLEGKK